MEVSDVRVRLVEDTNDRLKAVCSITLDDEFVVRDIKIVEGTNGLFVAMPSRKLSTGCHKCRAQNHLRAKFCNECGAKLPQASIPADANGREKAHRDIAHPITATFRQKMQECVIAAYEEACEEEGVMDDTSTTQESEPRESHEKHEPREKREPRDKPEKRGRRDEPRRERKEVKADVDEPVETDEPTRESREREALVSEYDSLIANLNPGKGDSSSRQEKRGEGEGRPRREEKKSRPPRQEGRKPRFLRDEAPAPAEEKIIEKKAVTSGSSSAPPREKKVVESRQDGSGDSVFGMGLDDGTSRSAVASSSANQKSSPRDDQPEDQVSIASEAEQPVTSDNSDDSSPFGAGLA